MSAGRMHQGTFEILRHVEVHGPRTKEEIKKAFADRAAGLLSATVNNLLTLGYLTADDTTKTITYTLTGKARKKLANPTGPVGTRRASAVLTPRRDPHLVQASSTTPAARAKYRPPKHHYSGAELGASARPGSMHAFEHPSRMGNTLRYRDGRVTDMDGNPITNP